MIDVKKVLTEARAEIAKEKAEKAKKQLVDKLRQLDAAKTVVANIEREITDLEARIVEGNY